MAPRQYGMMLGALTLATAATASELPQPVSIALSAVDHAAAAERESQAMPALALSVIHGDIPVLERAYGQANTETRFGVGSISKLFTAVAIIQLRDAGKLGLDDPVTRHLPWFRLAGEAHPRITIRELLLQLAGMAREPIGASWADQTMPSREALIRTMPDEPVTVPPETHWKYSNLGYAVLGLVVEAASGESYASYVTQHILQPLHMDRTVVGPDAAPDGMATGYGVRGKSGRESRPFLVMGGMTPAAGVISTAGDLGRFGSWMLSTKDDPVLSAQSRAEMERVQALMGDWSAGQGLGFEIRHKDSGNRIGHAGRAGGFAGVVEIDPASGIGVVALANADDATVRRLVERAIDDVGAAFAAAQPRQAMAIADPAWKKYVGTYSFDGRDSEIAIVDGRLAWLDPTAAAPVQSRIFLDPVAPNIFRFTSGGLIGETLTFELDAKGRVRRMLAGGGYDWKK